MANEKLTDKAAFPGGGSAQTTDLYHSVVVNDSTGSASGTSTKQTYQQLMNGTNLLTELTTEPHKAQDTFLISDNGTAKKITLQNMNGTWQDTVTLSEANITNLHTTPITCIAAVPSHVIVPLVCYAAFTHGTGAQSGKANLTFYLDGAADTNVLGTGALSGVSTAVWQINSTGGNQSSTNALDNLALMVMTSTAFTAGVFTACEIVLQYRLVKV